MKSKFYKKIFLPGLLLLQGVFASGQPLSGTYTIGGATPDYATFGGAVSAVQLNGVSGPVIFNVRDGIYHEKIIMYQFAGSSATNTVTFKSENGDSTLVTISDTASASATNNFTVQIFGADNVIFKKLTIQRPGTDQYGTVLEIGNTSSNISILNCQLLGGNGAGTSTLKCAVFCDVIAVNNDVNISHNLLANCSYGIYKQSSAVETGNVIADNIFQNQSGGAIYVDQQSGIVVSRNIITGTGNSFYRAIAFNNCNAGTTANKNQIAVNAASAGISYFSCAAIVGDENIAANNFVQVGGTSGNAGIEIYDSPNIKFYHNSVNRSGTGPSTSAIYMTGTTTGIQLLNNIFAHTGGGFAINSDVAGALSVSDYNDFYVTGSNVGSYNGSTAALLTDWQTLTTLDSNSVSANPVFSSVSDLHASSVGVNDLGVGLPSVVTDIDGEARSATTPDIGADEFTPLTDNVSLISIADPVNYACGDSASTVRVVVRNLGLNNASSIPVTVEITGPVSLTLMDTVTGPLASYSADTVTFTGAWNNYAGGVYQLKSYTSMPGDLNLANDTLSAELTILGIPNAPIVVSPQTFCENDVQLTATSDSGTVLYWYDAPSGGNLLFTGPVFSPPVTSDSIFYVESHGGTGSAGCLRITEIATADPAPLFYDHIEIQNCSSGPVDVTGWVVAVSEGTDINTVNANTWDLSSLGTMAPGQIEFKTDGPTNPWGINILWNPNALGWAMIIDNFGNIVDYVAWYCTITEIQSFSATINGFPITVGGSWNGDGFNLPVCNDVYARVGNSDNDDANDFICDLASAGLVNPGLNSPFPSCGTNACGSTRIPVSLILNPSPVVDLGPDTISGVPYMIDAGTASSYLWSNAATTQTITVSISGVYSVTVTDANGCTGQDSVNVILTIGMEELNSLTNFSVYPNPASDFVSVSFVSQQKQSISIRVVNALGEEVVGENLNSFSGSYHKNLDIASLAPGIYNFEVRTDQGILNKKFMVK